MVAGPFGPQTAKRLALLELDGEPAGYAIYYVQQEWEHGSWSGKVTVVEAVAPTPEGTRELWRWLLDFDWTSEFEAGLLPLDHPLFLLLAEPRRMRFQVGDGTWVRLIDVEAALAARSYDEDTQVVIELTDAFLPENAGRWRLGARGAERRTPQQSSRSTSRGWGRCTWVASRSPISLAAHVRRSSSRRRASGPTPSSCTSVQPWCAEIF